MYTTKAKNNMLDAIGATHASLHTAYSATGASEVTGGSPAYARKAISFSAAASGNKDSSTSPTFDVPAGTTVRFVGLWDAVSAGNFLGMSPNNGSEFEFYVDAAADKILAVAHPLVNDDKVVFYNGTVPAPLVEGTVYYVVNKTANDFQVAATQGGAAINLTAQATDAVVCSKIIEETFSAQGTHQITGSPGLRLGLNN